jgi:hypothetical protein
MAKSSFAMAERYIQLRKKYAPKSWADTIVRINEMILTPLITIFYILLNGSDFMTVVPAMFSTYQVWSGFIEFCQLRHWLQITYLKTMLIGGPFITTNDPEYLPYVYADAVTRLDMHRQRSGRARQREEP